MGGGGAEDFTAGASSIFTGAGAGAGADPFGGGFSLSDTSSEKSSLIGGGS